MQEGETFRYQGPAIRRGDQGDEQVEVDGSFTVETVDEQGARAIVTDARLADRSLGLDRDANSYRLEVADVDAYRAREEPSG